MIRLSTEMNRQTHRLSSGNWRLHPTDRENVNFHCVFITRNWLYNGTSISSPFEFHCKNITASLSDVSMKLQAVYITGYFRLVHIAMLWLGSRLKAALKQVEVHLHGYGRRDKNCLGRWRHPHWPTRGRRASWGAGRKKILLDSSSSGNDVFHNTFCSSLSNCWCLSSRS